MNNVNDIFKIQIPIVTTESDPQAFVYNESRLFSSFIPVEQVQELFEEGELKIFVRGNMIQDSADDTKYTFELNEVLGDQGW